jgi:ABC-type bacteriocin/lantibiotic exporter with double-glycine peptidase domain
MKSELCEKVLVDSGKQLPNHCGAMSLTICARSLGIIGFTQRDFAKFAGRPFKIFTDGLDEGHMTTAARKGGMTAKLFETDNYEVMRRKLVGHLKLGGVAIISVWKGTHWVSILGREKKSFLLFDSLNSWRKIYRNSETVLKKEMLDPGDMRYKFQAILLRKR